MLKDGFWFPPLKKTLQWLYDNASLERHFARRLAKDDSDHHLGAPELYQIIVAGVAALWLLLIHLPVSWLAGTIVRYFATAVLSYFIFELLTFLWHWILVSQHIADARRSLALFLFNFIELALLFTVIQVLTSCETQPGRWELLYSHLRALFTFELIGARPGAVCAVASHLEIILSATLLLVVIAGLVGTVVPPSAKEKGHSNAARTLGRIAAISRPGPPPGGYGGDRDTAETRILWIRIRS